MALISVSNNALQNITAVPASIPTGALVLLSTQTASSSASISFTSGIDSTYSSYVFKFINIHPSATAQFEFQTSTNGGSSYGVTATTTSFRAYHGENDAYGALEYYNADLAQSTSFQRLAYIEPAAADVNGSGYLKLFNPSSTTYVKHFLAVSNFTYEAGTTTSQEDYYAGYFNTTSAINAIRFQMSSGNIDDGIIKLYGVK